LLLACPLAACDAPHPPSPRLWTLFDVQALYAEQKPGDYAIATDAGLPGGVPLGAMVDATDQTRLHVHASWAESYAAAYVTTEVWTHFDEVWVQPMYVPITGWTNGAPDRVVDASNVWHPIFSVGPSSRFYSPYWQIIYAEVPPDSVDGQFTSTQQILDGGYPLVPSTGWVAALAPDGTRVDPDAPFPLGGGAGAAGVGWLDGAPISFVKFPAAPFAWDADLVVQEVPIFHFVFETADGTLVTPDIPSVLGTGPLYSHTPAPLDPMTMRPTARYSAYWRLYAVVVPPGARVFAPPGSATFIELDKRGVAFPTEYGLDITGAPLAYYAEYLGRVALNPTCFSSLGDAEPFTGTCRYLDSQEEIEANLPPGSIVATDVTVTCPLVSVDGVAVAP
jgi:hypothetical protein